MKLISQSTLSRLNNQTYSMGSFMELVGRQPEHLSDFLRLKKQTEMGLMSITEGMGNIYAEEGTISSKLGEISSIAFTFDVEASQIPTVRFSRAITADGSDGSAFAIYLEQRYFAKYDVAALENTQQLYFLTEGERITDNEYKYTVRAMSPSGKGIQTASMVKNKTLRYVYNLHPEFSYTGSNKNYYNMERHINYLSKIRAEQKYSSDFKAIESKFLIGDEDVVSNGKGGYAVKSGAKIYSFNTVEEQVLEHFVRSTNGAVIFGRTTMDDVSGRSFIQIDDNQDIIAGDGIIAQLERYAYMIDYNKLSVRTLQTAIEFTADKRGMSTGNNIVVICNRRFSRQKAEALQSAITYFAPQNNGAWFYTRDYSLPNDPYNRLKKKKVEAPNEVAVGATFNTYIYEGNTITFIVDEHLTNHYQDRGYAIFIDNGVYETRNGQVPGIHLKTLKGRSNVKGYVEGVGGADGTTSGTFSTSLDASTYLMTGWRAACVMNPYAAVIFEENV